MNRDSKNIRPTIRPQIEMCKGHIRTSRGWFDVDGNIGKTALRELRAAGWAFHYSRERGAYRITASPA